MFNIRKMVRVLPITFILMYALGVFGILSGVSLRNDALIQTSQLFCTYSIIPSFIVTLIFSFINIENKNTKLLIYSILFIILAVGLFIYIQNNNYESMEMMQNFILFPKYGWREIKEKQPCFQSCRVSYFIHLCFIDRLLWN